MKESAQAAVSYVRAHSVELGLPDDYFATRDLHIHVPAGAIPKDGPSAGVTMASAVASLVTGTPVSADVAMTGEITLTGQVLPIGGLKEKTLAAQRAGITTVILPSRNEADLEDVPEELRKGMTFVPVDRIEQVWKAAMGLSFNGRRERKQPAAVAADGGQAGRPARRRARGGRDAALEPPPARAPAFPRRAFVALRRPPAGRATLRSPAPHVPAPPRAPRPVPARRAPAPPRVPPCHARPSCRRPSPRRRRPLR